MENIENSNVLIAEIKSILAYKAKEGASYRDVKDEYASLTGQELCINSEKQFNTLMRSVPDVYATKGYNGHLVWFSSSSKSKHITKLVQQQKSPRDITIRQSVSLQRKLFYNSTSTCYYNDNYLYKTKRLAEKSYKSDSNLTEIRRIPKSSSFYNYDLVGDDFFLNIAHLDCKQKIEHIATKNTFKGRSIKVCGLCVSGLTIQSVTNMVKGDVKFNDQILLNIGSVDLLHGRSSMDMQSDFIELYAELEKRGIHTVITTLAPLANTLHSTDIQMRWQQFNSFLLTKFQNVIDLTCCFVSNTNRVLFECYQRTPKYVTGSNQAHLMWNYIGRQRVVKHLKESLAELGFRNSFFTNDSY